MFEAHARYWVPTKSQLKSAHESQTWTASLAHRLEGYHHATNERTVIAAVPNMAVGSHLPTHFCGRAL